MPKTNQMHIWHVWKQKLKKEMKTAVAVEMVVAMVIQMKVQMKISTQINKILMLPKSNYFLVH